MTTIPAYVSALLPSNYDGAYGDFFRWNANDPVGSSVTLSYTFATALPSYYSASEIPGFSVLDAAHQDAVRSVLGQISSLCNITFTEGSDPNACDLTFGGCNTANNINGYSYSSAMYGLPGSRVAPLTSGDVFLSNQSASSAANEAPIAGSLSVFTMLQEIGRALGLKRTFEGWPTMTSAGLADNHGWSMMSGTTTPHSYQVQNITGTAQTGYSWNYVELYPSTPMIYDIAALQYLYGANMSYRSGDDTYSWTANSAFYQTIWDAGGRNTIDVSNYTLSCIINLNPGTMSSIGVRASTADKLMDVPPAFRDWVLARGTLQSYVHSVLYDGSNNLGIAYGTTIQVAIGGSAADIILGNSAGDLLDGRGGNDTLVGGTGVDTLIGGAGADLLGGDSGADVFYYQSASDSTSSGYDVITDFTTGDKLSFAGVTGMRLRGTAYSFTSSVSATCSAIAADSSISNQFVTFASGGSCYVYAKGGGTGGTSYNGTLISLTGVSSLSAANFVGVLSTRATPFDLAGNGKSTVIWNNGTTGDVGYWSFGGASPSWNYLGRASTTMRIAGTGDFNGDGTTDILWQNPTNNYVGLWTMSGGTPSWRTVATGSTTMQIAGIGDFNGDGTSDILWQNPTNNYVGLWTMNNGNASWREVAYGSTTMRVAGIGDFNGDGTSDILWQNPTNNYVGLWTMNNGVASWREVAYGSTTMQIAGIGDFNGDGTSDILWQNPTNNYVGLWTITNGVASWREVAYGSTTMQIAGIADYNGDGTSDILWRNNSNGAVGEWQMNNGAPTWIALGTSSNAYSAVRV